MVLVEESTGAKTMNLVRDTLTLGVAGVETVEMSLEDKTEVKMQGPTRLTGSHVSEVLASP